MKEHPFAGTGKLLTLYLRRDRFILPVWILLPMIIAAGQISFVGAMPDWQTFIAELSASPLASAYLGPIFPLSMEGAILWRAMLQGATVVMMGTALTVIRHTRTEEQAGRTELISGRAVGRYANLTAALVLSCGGSLIAGLLTSAVLAGGGLAGDGSLLAGWTLAASGWIFAGIGGLCAQIFEYSGRARGVVIGAYGLMMIPMVLNNVGGGRTGWAWLASQSWYRTTVPYGENNIWPLFLFIVFSALPIGLSYALLARRDMGAGFMAQKDGTANASPRLHSPLALAWRQHKGSVAAWAVGMAFLGGSMGATAPHISESIGSMFAEMNAWAAAMAKLGNQEGFVAAFIYILGLMAGLSVFGITTVQSLTQEEKEHYAEAVLARPVSRLQWMGSYLSVAFAGSALILLALGLASGLGWSIVAGEFDRFFRVLGMSLSKIPSVWTIIGIAALLYGWLPRAASVLSWLILGLFIFVELLWEAGIVGWTALRWTPFAYAHYSIPVHELPYMPLLALVGIAAALTGIGLWRFRNRSIG